MYFEKAEIEARDSQKMKISLLCILGKECSMFVGWKQLLFSMGNVCMISQKNVCEGD